VKKRAEVKTFDSSCAQESRTREEEGRAKKEQEIERGIVKKRGRWELLESSRRD